jgi:hypothetical protein
MPTNTNDGQHLTTTDAPVPGPLIRLLDVPDVRWLPRRNGKKLHRSVPFRWAQHGLRGIQLRTLRVGGALCTCEEWLHEFFSAVTAAVPPSRSAGRVAPTKPSAAYERATAELRERGY